MPKLWDETIGAHRRAVQDATLDATAALVSEHGPLSVTMSQIASKTGIGRATLYKYFPNVEAILTAWHKRQITAHMNLLTDIRDRAGNPEQRIEAVLQAYALISSDHPDTESAAVLHRGEHLAHAQQHLRDFFCELLVEGVRDGSVRDDVAPDELASYCLCALQAANGIASKAAARRLVQVVLTGLRPSQAIRSRPPKA